MAPFVAPRRKVPQMPKIDSGMQKTGRICFLAPGPPNLARGAIIRPRARGTLRIGFRNSRETRVESLEPNGHLTWLLTLDTRRSTSFRGACLATALPGTSAVATSGEKDSEARAPHYCLTIVQLCLSMSQYVSVFKTKVRQTAGKRESGRETGEISRGRCFVSKRREAGNATKGCFDPV